MSNAKKIVIKINRSGAEKGNMPKRSAPSEIVIWNVRRIILAIVIAILFIILPYFFLSNGLKDRVDEGIELDSPVKLDDESPISDNGNQAARDKNQLNEKTISEAEKEAPIEKGFKTISHYKVTRGLLAKAIIDKEPAQELIPPFKISEGKTEHIYYFTELKDLKGQSFFHQWIKDGLVVGKIPINPQGNRWRVSSNRVLTHSDIGHWRVQLLDRKGLIYDEIVFEVGPE